MDSVPSRDLRNHTAAVLRRVRAGEHLAVTVRGEVVAELQPPRDVRPRFLSRSAAIALLTHGQADPGLRDDLARLAGDTTDDLGPP